MPAAAIKIVRIFYVFGHCQMPDYMPFLKETKVKSGCLAKTKKKF